MASLKLQVTNLQKTSKLVEQNINKCNLLDDNPSEKNIRKRLRYSSYSEGTNSLSDFKISSRFFEETEFSENRESKRIHNLYKSLQNLIFNECQNHQKFFLIDGLRDLYYTFCNSQARIIEMDSFISEFLRFDTDADFTDITESLKNLYDVLTTSTTIEKLFDNKREDELLKNRIQNLEKIVLFLWQDGCRKTEEIGEKNKILKNKKNIINKINSSLIRSFEDLMVCCGEEHQELLMLLKQHKSKLINEIIHAEKTDFRIKNKNLRWSFEFENLGILSDVAENLNPFQNKISELTKENTLLQNEILQLKSSNSALTKSVDLLEKEISELEHLNDDLLSNQHFFQNEIKKQDNYIQKLNKEINRAFGLNTKSARKLSRNRRDFHINNKFLRGHIFYERNDYENFFNIELINSINLLQNKIAQQEIVNIDLTALKNLFQYKIIQQERIISQLIQENDTLQFKTTKQT